MGAKLKITLELEKSVEMDFTHEIIEQKRQHTPFFFNDNYLFAHDVHGQLMIFELENFEKIGAIEFGKGNIKQIFGDGKYLYVHTENIVPETSNYWHQVFSDKTYIERNLKDLRIPAWHKKGDLTHITGLVENDADNFIAPENPLSTAGFKMGELEKKGFEQIYKQNISGALIPANIHEFANMFFNNNKRKLHIVDPCFSFYQDIMLIPDELQHRWLQFESMLDHILVRYQKDASDIEPSLQMIIKDNKIYSIEQFKQNGMAEEFDKQAKAEKEKDKNKLVIFRDHTGHVFREGEGYFSAKSDRFNKIIEVNRSYFNHTSPGILGFHTNGDTFYVLTNIWVYGGDMKPITIVDKPNKLLKFKITSKNSELQEMLATK
jgi:hypothetical protein